MRSKACRQLLLSSAMLFCRFVTLVIQLEVRAFSASGLLVMCSTTWGNSTTHYLRSFAVNSIVRRCLEEEAGGWVVWAPDFKSGGPGFKSRSDHYLELFHGSPEFNSSVTLVNNQLACLLPVGIFNPVMFTLKYLFLIFVCSRHYHAPWYNSDLPRVNKGHFLWVLALWNEKIVNLSARYVEDILSCYEFLRDDLNSIAKSAPVRRWRVMITFYGLNAQLCFAGKFQYTLFLYKNVVFPTQAEYSYFSYFSNFRLKIFLYYS